MKVQLSLLALLATIGFAASAQVTVDQLTCAQAQMFAKKYKRYYKDAGPDGAIPIYPVYQLNDVNCGGRTTTTAELVRTLDTAECVIGYYCKSY